MKDVIETDRTNQRNIDIDPVFIEVVDSPCTTKVNIYKKRDEEHEEEDVYMSNRV